MFLDKTALCSVNQGGDTGPNHISPGAVALSTAVVLVNGLLSLWLKLDMHWQLLIGAIRSTPLPVLQPGARSPVSRADEYTLQIICATQSGPLLAAVLTP